MEKNYAFHKKDECIFVYLGLNEWAMRCMTHSLKSSREYSYLWRRWVSDYFLPSDSDWWIIFYGGLSEVGDKRIETPKKNNFKSTPFSEQTPFEFGGCFFVIKEMKEGKGTNFLCVVLSIESIFLPIVGRTKCVFPPYPAYFLSQK